MADGPIVSNTTPLIILAGVGLIDLLPRLYGELWVPTEVVHEYRAGIRAGEPRLDTLAWLVVKEVSVDQTLPRSLGDGEAAAISLALASMARGILLDERLARRIALARGLPVIATLAVLLRAKRQGLLPAVRPVLEAMIAQGRRISPALTDELLRAAGEDS